MRVIGRSLGDALCLAGLLGFGLLGCGASDPASGGSIGGASGALNSAGNGAGAGSNSNAGTGTSNAGTGGAGTSTVGSSGSTGPSGAGTSSGGGVGGSGMAGAGVSGNTFVGTGCINGNTQCTNCIDDDGDGLVDALDPECVGPLDSDEATYATGIPGDNKDPKWQDCFFDGNSGAGDDGCRYSTGCLTNALPTTDADCQVNEQCRNFCAQLTPNGCDCFGCCEVYREGVPYHVQLTGTCSAAVANDPTKCPVCTQTTTCANDCGRCELCLGKTSVPADCAPPGGTGGASGAGGSAGTSGAGNAGNSGSGNAGTTGSGTVGTPPIDHTCSSGAAPCDGNHPCSSGQYCLTGCCMTGLT